MGSMWAETVMEYSVEQSQHVSVYLRTATKKRAQDKGIQNNCHVLLTDASERNAGKKHLKTTVRENIWA
jgi:hypothetical protein